MTLWNWSRWTGVLFTFVLHEKLNLFTFLFSYIEIDLLAFWTVFTKFHWSNKLRIISEDYFLDDTSVGSI